LRSSTVPGLEGVRQRIAAAAERAGRAAEEITLVAITKGRSVSDVRHLYDLGIRHFGENRIPEAEPKILEMPPDVVWHMVGNLQRRKAAAAVRLFKRVDAVDRVELAQVLSRRAHEIGKTLEVLVEVNVSGEAAKHGLAPDALTHALEEISSMPNIRVGGLMTMAPFTEDDRLVREVFQNLYNLSVGNQLPIISMGMSSDFEIAIEEGATEVRIGTALFA